MAGFFLSLRPSKEFVTVIKSILKTNFLEDRMDNQKPQVVRGLRDVIAGQTSICFLDELNQRLYYRGYAIEDLAAHSTFEDVAYMLIFGEFDQLNDEWSRTYREMFLLRMRSMPDAVFQTLRSQSREANPMNVLQTLIAALGNTPSAIQVPIGPEDEFAKIHSISLVASVGYLVGVMARWYGKKRPLRLSTAYESVAKNILYQIYGIEPDEFETRLMDIALILYAEHEFNASTFAVRVAASAHTDIFSAIVAGIGTLRGTRHGGANEAAMKMMLEIGTPENVRAWCDKFFETPGARLPGFGHAVYTRGDPRVPILRPLVRELSERKGDMRWYEIGVALEEYMDGRAAQKGRGIPANMDLWTAPLYYLLDIPISMYTPLFAASRVAGWCAHYLEVRYENNEPIIRPRAEYIGPAPRPFVRVQDPK